MPNSPPRLMLVEDDPADALLVRLHVEAFDPPGRLDHEVTTVAQAVDLLLDGADQELDAILLDLGLPDGRGLDVVRKVMDVASGVPVIVLTGRDDHDEVGPLSVAAGAQDYLTKAATNAHQLERAVRYAMVRHRAAAHVAQANRDIEQLVYSVTHDLKNPLMVAQGFVDVILGKHADDLPADVIDSLQRVVRQHRRMTDLIADLLHYARALHGEVVVADNDIAHMVRQVLHDEGLADRLDVEMNGPPTVAADPRLLHQAVTNIMVNTVKYRHPDRRARLVVTAEQVGWATRLTFADNGRGIPADRREEMFQMFSRGPDASVDGTGIGLSIVRRAIERHDGTVHLEDGLDGGTAVVMTLPDRRREGTRP